jgi:hypothetical protein
MATRAAPWLLAAHEAGISIGDQFVAVKPHTHLPLPMLMCPTCNCNCNRLHEVDGVWSCWQCYQLNYRCRHRFRCVGRRCPVRAQAETHQAPGARGPEAGGQGRAAAGDCAELRRGSFDHQPTEGTACVIEVGGKLEEAGAKRWRWNHINLIAESESMKVLGPILFAVIMVIFAGTLVSSWNECRTGYSFLYCVVWLFTPQHEPIAR